MKILFLDCETTGTDPDVDIILEVGCILYDIVEERELWRSLFITAPPEVRFAPMDKIVREMHTKSGLFDTMIATGDNFDELASVERIIMNALDMRGLGPQSCIMGGFSPHFDRAFLRVEMPWLERYLHHRLLDVSTLRELTFAWTGSKPDKVDRHRALPDCEEAIATLRSYRKLIAPQGLIVEPVG